MILSFIGDMTIEHSSGGNSTEALLASEMENMKLRFRLDHALSELELRQALNTATTFLNT